MTELYPVNVLVLVHRNALIMAIILLKTRSVVLTGVAVGRICVPPDQEHYPNTIKHGTYLNEIITQ